jgi:pyrroloquinoline-quinone synthase
MGTAVDSPAPDQVPLAREAFRAALEEQSNRYHHKHPFHVLMNAGGLNRAQIKTWVANRFYYQKNIPIKDSAILSNCPKPAIRRRWIQRILDHDGAAEGQGGIEAWLRLAEAVGLSRLEVEDDHHVLPGVRFAVDANVTFARTRPWIEAVAATLTELFAPDLMRERLAAFERHYTWVDPAGLAYFKARLTQAPRDAAYALDLVIHYCTTREQQERTVAALAFKCDVLWSMLDAIHHAAVGKE